MPLSIFSQTNEKQEAHLGDEVGLGIRKQARRGTRVEALSL